MVPRWLKVIASKVLSLLGLLRYFYPWSQDTSFYKDLFVESFEEAKRLSDFVGMMVRLVFIALASMYLFQSSFASVSPDTVHDWLLFWAGIGSAMLGVTLGLRIFNIVVFWTLLDIRVRGGYLVKILMLIMAAVLLMVFYVGAWHVVRGLAGANDLLRR